MNLRIYLAGLFGFKISPDLQTTSFVVDEKNIDIEIIDLNKDTDRNNLTNYLKHHIMLTDDKFHPMYFFDEPLVVRFKYQNETYRICLKQLEAQNTDHSVSMNEPKYLSAIIENDEGNEGLHITDLLVEYHGPDRNFFKHIPDTVNDIPLLLAPIYKGCKLHTFNMMGTLKVHDL